MPKSRRILVDGLAYRWRVQRLPEPYPGHVEVGVWRDGRPRGRAIAVRVRFDDPWLNFGPMLTTPTDRRSTVWATEPVTPRHVAAMIRGARAHGWDPSAAVTTPIQLAWESDAIVPR